MGQIEERISNPQTSPISQNQPINPRKLNIRGQRIHATAKTACSTAWGNSMGRLKLCG